jgi:E1A/CREB-binding protein
VPPFDSARYVQEYDGQCNFAANRNRAYIAYIDSLVYMRPRHVRTNLFHQILISYLANCKDRGFEYAHIWACPTTRGGDFIYWCHPSFQKNPGKDRLLQWYLGMVVKGKQNGVVFDCKDLYACEFESLETSLTTRLPPYFEGDYWPSEVERLAACPPKRGKLTKEAYAESLKGQRFRKRLVDSVKGARDSLFVIALQPACSRCQRLVVKPTADCASTNTRAELCGACSSSGNSTAAVLESAGRPDGVEDAELSCPFVDYRPSLLQNCEERHYQFDSYRRAKYSTMMLIYEIHSSQRARQ